MGSQVRGYVKTWGLLVYGYIARTNDDGTKIVCVFADFHIEKELPALWFLLGIFLASSGNAKVDSRKPTMTIGEKCIKSDATGALPY